MLSSVTDQLTLNGSPDFTVAGSGSVMLVTTSCEGGGGSIMSGGGRYRLSLFWSAPSNTEPIGLSTGGIRDDEEIVWTAQVRWHLHRGRNGVAGPAARPCWCSTIPR